MKNKKILLSLVVVFVSIIGLFAITRVYTSTIIVRSDLANINEAMLNNKKMLLWLAPFADMDSSKINTSIASTVNAKNTGSSIKFKTKKADNYIFENEARKNIAFTISPKAANQFAVTINYESNIWNRFIIKSSFVKNALASISNLEQYFANTKKRYGYDIKETIVNDTTVIFKSIEVPTATKIAATNQLFNELIAYSASINAQYNGIRLLHYIQLDETKTKIFASIGVLNSKLEYNLKPPFEFKRMPYKKKLLELTVQGNLAEIEKATRALDRFKSDEHYSSMAIPFMKIKDSTQKISENSKLDVLIHYPVY